MMSNKRNGITLETSACVMNDLRVFSMLSQEGYLIVSSTQVGAKGGASTAAVVCRRRESEW